MRTSMPGGTKPPTDEEIEAMANFIVGDKLYLEVKPWKRNVIRCVHCDTFAESKHRHHMQSCKCGRVAADGGLDYLRRACREEGDFVELSEKNPDYKGSDGF